jgi:hypothetical protein
MLCSVLQHLGIPALLWPAYSDENPIVQEYHSQVLDAVPDHVRGFSSKAWRAEIFQPDEDLPSGLQHPHSYRLHASQAVIDKVLKFRPSEVQIN